MGGEDEVVNSLLPHLYEKLDTMRSKLARSNKALKVRRGQVQVSAQRIAELEDELPKLRGDLHIMEQSHEKLVSTIVEVQRAFDRIVQSGKALSRLMDADSERCDKLAGPDACSVLEPKPDTAGGQPQFWTPFEQACEGFVSVCPGDESLFVGGGALNGAFGGALKACGHEGAIFKEPHTQPPKVGTFEELHHRGFKQASQNPEKLVEIYDRQVPNVIYSAARTWKGAGPHTFGTCFINILHPDYRPPDGAIGFVYVVGPLGQNARAPGEPAPDAAREQMVIKNREQFLQFLTRMTRSLMEGVNEYNVHCLGKDLPRMEKMRVPLISGATFRHPEVKEAEVAAALLLGLREAWQRGTSPSLSLAPGFRDAYEATKPAWSVL